MSNAYEDIPYTVADLPAVASLKQHRKRTQPRFILPPPRLHRMRCVSQPAKETELKDLELSLLLSNHLALETLPFPPVLLEELQKLAVMLILELLKNLLVFLLPRLEILVRLGQQVRVPEQLHRK